MHPVKVRCVVKPSSASQAIQFVLKCKISMTTDLTYAILQGSRNKFFRNMHIVADNRANMRIIKSISPEAITLNLLPSFTIKPYCGAPVYNHPIKFSGQRRKFQYRTQLFLIYPFSRSILP